MIRRLKRTGFRACAASVLLLAGLHGAVASAADFPQRPIKIVVGFGPGGATDLTTRELARRLESMLKQPVLVENKPSAGAIVAMQAVATAQPDGYTLMMGTPAGFSTSPYLFKKIPYAVTDFVPIAPVSTMANVVVTSKSSPLNSLTELLQHAKGEKQPMTYGSFGSGTTGHLGMEMFKSATGLQAVHVAYKGDSPELVAVMSHEVDIGVMTMFTAQARIASGEIKGLGVLQSRPDRSLPHLQTAAQAGVPEVDLPSWLALFAPSKTRPEIVRKLEDSVRSVLATPDFQSFLAKNGSEPLLVSNEDLTRMIAKQSAVLAAEIKQLNLSGDQ